MNSIDELLAELQAEYKEKEQAEATSKVTSSPQPSQKIQTKKSSSPMNKQADDSSSLSNLLNELKGEFEDKKEKLESKKQQLESKSSARNIAKKRRSPKPEISDNSLLQELQLEYQRKDKAQQEQREQQRRVELKRQEMKRKRRRQALTSKAQEWLKNLDSNSDEGLWFEEFSYSYDSQLEAAIDYLEALRETRFHS